MRLPDFLGIGAQKGGTTYLHGLLQQHPQVCMAHPKELHYFSLHHDLGLDWYAKHFSEAPVEQRCGEVTPYYLFHPQAAERIHAVIPNVKLIVLLRDPVERALSQYFHSRRLGLEPLKLEAAFEAESERLADADEALKRGETHRSHQEHSYLSRSRYEQQLPRFQDLFGPNQLLILRSEVLYEQPKRTWEYILHFLELKFYLLPTNIPHYRNSGNLTKVHPKIHRRLKNMILPTYNWLGKI